MAALADSTLAPAHTDVLTVSRLRDLIAAEVERLVALLDFIDGDPDIEATALERAGGGFVASGDDDAEEDDEDTWEEPEFDGIDYGH